MSAFYFALGHVYFAGFDSPALIPASTVRSAVEAEGFKVLGDWPCKNWPALPVKVPGRCGDEWDWLALVRRTGPSSSIELPDRVKWVIEVEQPTATAGPSVPGPSVPAPPAPAPPLRPWATPAGLGKPTTGVGYVVALGIGLGLLGLVHRRRQAVLVDAIVAPP